MAKLIAKPALETGMPFAAGDAQLSMPDLGCLTSIAPFDGALAAVAASLMAAHGLGFPEPSKMTVAENAQCIWWGRGQAMLVGPAVDDGLAKHAALTDQSDGWVAFLLDGAGSTEVLSRLTPIDMRLSVFPDGHTARTQLGHMMASITRTGAQQFRIMVFRSMVQTALHELQGAMKAVAAQS
ncbi:sarcosine oxidase subunit gamma [Actibacterium lipolyticum]|uniref:Sarcosine oxidase, gamma subunit family n=1 Tax=Actibacterium lipolyticum TaxID=1524263 RepID=A0A238JRZ1_9RHOB|nr:sarcosine oxidase subunit gamma [Actibacterium lipolyticum]SMX33411.1 Sarcosine oxidase, gamma subunit family [Actibacterium lipolyticum]